MKVKSDFQRKRIILLFLALVSAMLSIGCLGETVQDGDQSIQEKVGTRPAWMDIGLRDVSTGQEFKISDFVGKPVLMESFAVWCPTCTEQQKQTKELEKRVGDAIIHISLDTDPNEDEEQIREHIEKNGFTWLYAVSPIELTQGLIDQYSIKVVNAPAVPMVLICPDQSTRFLRSGVKTPDDLINEVEKGC